VLAPIIFLPATLTDTYAEALTDELFAHTATVET
jgi:hypothetical protein